MWECENAGNFKNGKKPAIKKSAIGNLFLY